MDEDKTKECPFCGEKILGVAVKCKHCGSDLSQLIASANAEALRGDLRKAIQAKIEHDKPAKTKKLFFAPDIPAEKLSTAREKYAARISIDEEIFVLGENKSMGFFYSGFVLTDLNLYYYGVNETRDTLTGDPRKGVVPLHQIKSLEFKNGGLVGRDYFVLNGMGPNESDLIPKCFEFGDVEREFLTKVFTGIEETLLELGGEIQKTKPKHDVVLSPRTTKGAKMPKTDNPVEAGHKPEPGCLKMGCGTIIGISILALGLLALIFGLSL
jgi:hypothetical protein